MIVAFDLETTGLDPRKDKIIEIALIKFDENTFEVLDEFTQLIDPEIPIPELISNITHIFDADVTGAPKFQELKQKIADFIGGNPVLGHNINFDVDFLVEKGIAIGNNIKLDTFFLANILKYHLESLNLEILSKGLGVSFSGAHRAYNDVEATIAVFKALVDEFKNLDEKKKQLIKYIFTLSPDENIVFLGELLQMSSIKTLKFKDFSNILLENVGKFTPSITQSESNIDKVDTFDFFMDNDKVETRDNQLKMAKYYENALDKKQKILVEAPTGLGKSFAYLVPALHYAVKNNKKVYISTKTKALQDQLYSKDLQFLTDNISIDFSYSKIKGKRNYLYLQAFFEVFKLEYFDYDDVGLFSKLCLWLMETVHGELDELHYYPFEYKNINYLHADNHQVLSEKNIYKEYEFLFKARKQLEQSDIVIINHALLFSDFAKEQPILKDMKNLIIDEAHSIEDSVTDSLKKRYSYKSVKDILEKIESIMTNLKLKKIEFLTLKNSLLDKLYLYEDLGREYILRKEKQDSNFKTTLLDVDFFEELDFESYNQKIQLLFIDIVDFLVVIEDYDFSQEVQSLNYFSEILAIIFHKENTQYIKIINFSERYGCNFDYTLLSPSKYLEKNIWKALDSCLLTSATLTINNSFDYFKQTLGLSDFETAIFETDFDYSKQSTLIIPNDLGSIKNNASQILHFLDKFYHTVRGNTLTLLTSFNMIKKIYTNSNLSLNEEGVNLYAQSLGGSKGKLLSQFTSQPDSSILLGTNSFWEGIDIPGNTIKYLVIHKFPFQVPTDPIFVARSKFYKDPFNDYSIPKAIIMLKQGFGRLIRSKTDSGMVILLDDRIVTTKWGEVFFNSFPSNINKKVISSQKFLDVLAKK